MATLISSLYLRNFFIFHISKWIWTHPTPTSSPFMETDTRALTPTNVCSKMNRKRDYRLFKNNLFWGKNKLEYNISCHNSVISFEASLMGRFFSVLLATLIRRLAQFVNSFSWDLCKPSYCNNVKLTSLRKMSADDSNT